MVVSCAWCNKILGHVEPLADPSVTHGICSDCFDKEVSNTKSKPVEPPGDGHWLLDK